MSETTETEAGDTAAHGDGKSQWSHRVTCPNCGADKCNVDYELKWRNEQFGSYRVAQCRSCGIAFVDPPPSDRDLELLYEGEEYHAEVLVAGDLKQTTEAELDGHIRREERGIVERYRKWLPPSGKLLEIGCAGGVMLKAYERQGYCVEGVEMSKTQCHLARERLGLNVRNETAETAVTGTENEFDIVFMRHVLEHLRDPREVLSGVNRLLKPSGVAVVIAPNYGSYDRRAYGDNWPAFAPYHLWYFTRRSLTQMLVEAGFEPIAFVNYVSELILPRKNTSVLHRVGRRIVSLLGGNRFLAGRSMGIVARCRKVAGGEKSPS